MTDPKTFRPAGFNLGGWMSQSPLTDAHVDSFLGPADLRMIASWGFTSVRLPVDAAYLFSDGGRGPLNPARLARVKNACRWAWDAGLHVVLDLHQCAWHSFTDAALTDLWTRSDAREAFAAQWEELASALRSSEGPLWVEPLNEPTASNPSDWNRVAKRLVEAIHRADPDRVVVVESTQWGHVDHLESLAREVAGEGVVLSFHFYEPLFFTHQKAPWWKDGEFYRETVEYPGEMPLWREYLLRADLPASGRALLERRGPVHWDREALRGLLAPAFALRKRGVPLYCGEFGVYEITPRASRLAYLRDMMPLFRDLGAGWAYWNFKHLDFGVFSKTPDGGTSKADEEVVQILRRGV